MSSKRTKFVIEIDCQEWTDNCDTKLWENIAVEALIQSGLLVLEAETTIYKVEEGELNEH